MLMICRALLIHHSMNLYAIVGKKIVFLCYDGASIKSGVKKGLAITFWETSVPWLVFVW